MGARHVQSSRSKRSCGVKPNRSVACRICGRQRHLDPSLCPSAPQRCRDRAQARARKNCLASPDVERDPLIGPCHPSKIEVHRVRAAAMSGAARFGGNHLPRRVVARDAQRFHPAYRKYRRAACRTFRPKDAHPLSASIIWTLTRIRCAAALNATLQEHNARSIRARSLDVNSRPLKVKAVLRPMTKESRNA